MLKKLTSLAMVSALVLRILPLPSCTDTANIRSGYAAVQVQILTEDGAAGTYYLMEDGSAEKNDSAPTSGLYKTKGKNTDANVKVGGEAVGAWEADKTVTYTVANGEIEKIEVK